MILYLDTSAIVKRYIRESGSQDVEHAVHRATFSGSAFITRAEVAAAFAKAVRIKLLDQESARQNLETFRQDWNDYERLEVSEVVVARADDMAWQHGLRGYDAVQLAAALIWQETLESAVTFATYDKNLWVVARQVGLEPFPPKLVED
jgi:predicted nucleic acid-binding protein